jgi:hypothetical protein
LEDLSVDIGKSNIKELFNHISMMLRNEGRNHRATFVGDFRLKAYTHLPAAGTREGIIMLWDGDLLHGSDILVGSYCIFLTMKSIHDDFSFRLTSVYGPTRNSNKEAFFAELIDHKPLPGIKWVVNGDFNQIYRARETKTKAM